MKRAIVIGATSGIGRSLALMLANDGYLIGITGRRSELLGQLKAKHPESFIVSKFDLSDAEETGKQLDSLKTQLGGLDLLILSSGNGFINETLNYTLDKQTIDLNVAGFTAVANWAFNVFKQQGQGHFAAITSIAGLRGSKQAPAYGASKAYQINYLQALAQKAVSLKLPIYVTDIRPGFVDTAMAKGDGLFWVAPVDKAARQIVSAIKNKRSVVYITKRWRLIAIFMKLLPNIIYNKL